MGKSKKASRKAKGDFQQHRENNPAIEGDAPDALAEQSGTAEALVSTRASKKKPAPKIPRDERSGVRRPGPGKCLEVWEYLDQCGDVEAKDLKPVAVEKGWNANNALIELYRWRKFNGVARAVAK